ncbi:MAG: oligopeptide/dipeptide ABC transporter ATP-binding protein [Pseudomonadota bacterium]
MSASPPLLQVIDLARHFPGPRRGLLGLQRGAPIKALDGVSFAVASGRTLALVGESGCGKSTLARTLLRLHEPTRGTVLLEGEDLVTMGRKALLERRRDLQMIFQDPWGSLNPRRTVGASVREPLDIHRVGTAEERRARVSELLAEVGLPDDAGERYPHAFSGGQRQRIGIARALALSPRFVVADEPVSALDVSVQAQILALLAKLQEERSLSYLFISHDLAVVRQLAHEVAVMYLGKIVEQADAQTLFSAPAHPYTQALISAVPVPDPKARERTRIVLPGDPPDPSAPPPGCPFHPRCPAAMDSCRRESPPRITLGTAAAGGGHEVSCHLHVPAT